MQRGVCFLAAVVSNTLYGENDNVSLNVVKTFPPYKLNTKVAGPLTPDCYHWAPPTDVQEQST